MSLFVISGLQNEFLLSSLLKIRLQKLRSTTVKALSSFAETHNALEAAGTPLGDAIPCSGIVYRAQDEKNENSSNVHKASR